MTRLHLRTIARPIPSSPAHSVARALATIAAVALAIVVGAGTVGCHGSASSSKALKPMSPTAKKLNDLAVFALGHALPAAEIDEKEKEITSGKLTYESYIDSLLKQPMGPRLSRDITMGATSPYKDRHPVPASYILRSTKEKDGKEKVYYLREKCSPDEAVRVKPWWDTSKEILVCKDAYRPDVKGDADGRTCGAEMLAPRDANVCGCGPYLMYCTQDREQWSHTMDHVQAEVLDTAAYIVDGDQPIEKLFTMNETVRDNDAEFLYRRARVLAGEDPDKLFPVEGYGDGKGKLMPRTEMIPGQHAGVLTTPAMIYSSDALRGVMRNYYDWLWCSGQQSSKVTTQSVLGLGTVDLRVGDGWKKLAGMNICTDCHARLDYGMQFFWGYPSSTKGVDFRPSLAFVGQQGPLYRRSIKDQIGTADLNPAGFAKLVTQAPEFGDCMTRRVVDHVFGGTDSSKDYQAVRDEFDKSHKIKQMMRVAMLRYAARKDDDVTPSAPKTDDALAASTNAATNGATNGATNAGDAEKVALSPALQKMIKKDCKECHDKDDSLNLMVTELDKKTLGTMLDRVGFRAMPKNAEGIDDPERRAFVAELAKHIYSAPDERKIATDFYADGMRGLPVHRFFSATTNITAAAQAVADAKDIKTRNVRGFRPSTIESSIAESMVSYSPSIAVATAVSAMRACKEAGLQGSALAECVDKATSPELVINGSVPH